jgi:hypothetical protein
VLIDRGAIVQGYRFDMAKAMGLVTKIFSASEIDLRCAASAKRVASGSPLIFQAIKESVQA